jgi:hypothetical protein
MQEVNECEGEQRYKSVVARRLRSSDHPTAAARALHRMHFADTNLSAISLNYERAYAAINLNYTPPISVLVAAVSRAAVLFAQPAWQSQQAH